MKINYNWIGNPTKQHLLFVTVLGLISAVGYIIPMTNFFSENPFQARYFIFWFSLVLSLLIILTVYRNYFKQRKAD
jgi:hypothetical protein